MNISDNQHVLWLTSSYPRFRGDSASIFLQKLASSLASQKTKIKIIFPDDILVDSSYHELNISKLPFRYFLPRKGQKLAFGSGILPNLTKNKWLIFQVPFFMLFLFLKACKSIIKQKPKIIHAHWVFPNGFIAVLLGKIFSIPIVVTTHGGDAFSLNQSPLSAIKKWTIKHSTCWTSNTNATAISFGPELPAPKIIPMGIDCIEFSSGKRKTYRKNQADNEFNILFVGRLVEKKGVHDLISAFSKLEEKYRQTSKLWIVGDGHERKILEDQVARLNLSSKVRFFGKLPNKELPDIYASADLFVAPSIIDANGDTEGQGVILLEAMASKTPIISTNVGGIDEVICHKRSGILIEPNSPEELKQAIIRMMSNKNECHYLSEEGIKRAKQYDWPVISLMFKNLYTDLVGSF